MGQTLIIEMLQEHGASAGSSSAVWLRDRSTNRLIKRFLMEA